jgi:hypothetical protein
MPFRLTLTKVRVVTRDKTEEFLDFHEARQVYPDLDPYRGSKTFTGAMDDGDAMLFETWEIHNSLSED